MNWSISRLILQMGCSTPLKSEVTNSGDGEQYHPLVVINPENAEVDSQINLGKTGAFGFVDGNIVLLHQKTAVETYAEVFDSSGVSQAQPSTSTGIAHHCINHMWGNKVLSLAKGNKNSQCGSQRTVDFNADPVLKNEVAQPASNQFFNASSIAVNEGSIYVWTADRSKIYRLNDQLVIQETMVTSALLMPKSHRDVARLVTLADGLYIASLVDDVLTLRKIEFVENAE